VIIIASLRQYKYSYFSEITQHKILYINVLKDIANTNTQNKPNCLIRIIQKKIFRNKFQNSGKSITNTIYKPHFWARILKNVKIADHSHGIDFKKGLCF